jgi:hypothetical protein
MSVEAWVHAPESLRCGACQAPVVLTSRDCRPVSRCTNQACGLIVLGAYDLRLDERANRHPAVQAQIRRDLIAQANAATTIDALIESALLDGSHTGG